MINSVIFRNNLQNLKIHLILKYDQSCLNVFKDLKRNDHIYIYIYIYIIFYNKGTIALEARVHHFLFEGLWFKPNAPFPFNF